MIRKPAVAGMFYPSSPKGLEGEVKGLVDDNVQRMRAIGLVSPHAGLMYSGAVAGAVYSRITSPHTFIIISPNHTGLGARASLMTSGEWQIPTGKVSIDETLAMKLLANSEEIEEDTHAHLMEHSIEVQLPFICHFFPDAKIAPLTLMSESVEACRRLGIAVADAVRNSDYPVTIAASSDMTHYEEDRVARKKDKAAIERIIALDPKGLYQAVKEQEISMCGFIPVTVMLYAALELGAKEASLVKYMTSGDVSGDYGHVVGYAGVIVK
ncbi:MAG: AmmeMemoRadiSam system protein B [Nitrospirae bacterium]|nr:AmmeMemoRadiSam system protein B [Nitrospirota bacterium]